MKRAWIALALLIAVVATAGFSGRVTVRETARMAARVEALAALQETADPAALREETARVAAEWRRTVRWMRCLTDRGRLEPVGEWLAALPALAEDPAGYCRLCAAICAKLTAAAEEAKIRAENL